MSALDVLAALVLLAAVVGVARALVREWGWRTLMEVLPLIVVATAGALVFVWAIVHLLSRLAR